MEIGFPHQHTKQFGLAADKVSQIEFLSLSSLCEQQQPRVKSKQILSIPTAVIISLVGKALFVPRSELFVHQQVQLEMHVGAVFGNSFSRVSGPPHDRDWLASFDRLADFQSIADFAQMR